MWESTFFLNIIILKHYIIMNKIVVIFLSLLISNIAFAQTSNCQQAISNELFQNKLIQIKSQKTDQKKLITSNQFVKRYCFSSTQVKEIAALFEDDFSRLQFAKRAYFKVVDKENFYDVYDAFIYYSVVFRLHDYTKSLNKESNNSDSSSGTSNKVVFPNYNYPKYSEYEGEYNCTDVISRSEFIQLAKKIKNTDEDNIKLKKAKELTNEKCLSTTQIMKLASLIKSDNLKFNFAKHGYYIVSDIENYSSMLEVFESPRLKMQFRQFLNSNQNSCKVSQQEFDQIAKSISMENFNSAKVNTAKHLIEQKNCFTPQQILKIVEDFSYENSKLEIAIFAYKHSIEKENYYSIVSGALGFNSSKKKLLNYINSQK